MASSMNMNDPRVKRTRQLLQNAFTELVREKSFDTITVHDIAERATVNRATFYAHFVDKYALVDATLGISFTEMLVDRLLDDAPLNEETVRILIVAICDFQRNISRQCARAYREFESTLEPRIITYLHEIVRACLERTPLSAAGNDQMREATAAIASWSIYGAALHWHKAESSQPAVVFAEMVSPLIVDGITAMSEPAARP